MNFLQLCQRACVECGVASNSAIMTALPTVVGASGSLGRVVNWVGDAWNELQEAHDDWDWMRSSNLLGAGVSFPTIYAQYSYPLGLASSGDFGGDFGGDFAGGASGVGTVGVAVDSFGKWDKDSFRSYPTAFGTSGEMFLDEIPFDSWRNSYMLGAMRRVRTRPIVIAIGPDQSLNLGPPPDGLYTITGDYWVAPSLMEADTDVPFLLPTRFHLMIVYKAMMKYAGYESAPEVYTRGSEEWAPMYARLQRVRAPTISFGGALA